MNMKHGMARLVFLAASILVFAPSLGGAFLSAQTPTPSQPGAAPVPERPSAVPDSSASSAPATPPSSAAELPAFIRENLPSFGERRLSNGIPVYLKRSSANRVRNLSLVLRGGGSLAVPPQEAGWAKLALATMARSSSAYPYAAVVDLLDATSSSIGSAVQFEYSTFSLNALDKYFDRLLPVWADMIVSPSFTQSDFEQARSEAVLALQSKEQDPWTRVGKIMNADFFAGHPYAVNPDGTEESLQAASPEAMRAWYRGNMSADRIFVVAVGDFDLDALAASLDPTIGTLPDRGLAPLPKAPRFAAKTPGGLVTEDDEQSRNIAYLRGDFPAPAPKDPDYTATNVAMKLFSDLLFQVVRDKYGAVYTPDAAIRAFGANYGSVSMYKTTKPGSIKAYIDEAASILASGRCVSVDPSRPGEEAVYMKLEDALATYKRMFTNTYFAAVRTNAAVAGLVARSVVLSGDPADWLYDVQRIASVTPSQVQNAFETYVLKGAFTWVAVGDPKLLSQLDPASFSRFALQP